MGRHVVITFESNAEAAEFVEAMKVAGEVFFQGADKHFKNINPETAKVTGVFMKPTQFCDCPDRLDDDMVRGSKWGLIVHTKCAKPRGGLVHNPRNLLFDEPPPLGEQHIWLNSREGEQRRFGSKYGKGH